MNLLANLRGDWRGGITAAAVAVPQCLGYGLLAFAALGPEFTAQAAVLGFYAAIFPCFASFLGSNPIQINIPAASVTIILASALTTLAGDPRLAHLTPADRQILLVGLSATMVLGGGLLQVALGKLGLGAIFKYVPYPVISGFMNGIAIIIIEGQIKVLLGLARTVSYAEIIAHPQSIKLLSVIVGLGTLMAISRNQRHHAKMPWALAALLVGIILYYALSLVAGADALGPVLGSLEATLPWPDVFPEFILQGGLGLIRLFLPQIIITAGLMALIGSMFTLLSAVACDKVTGFRHNNNQELMGQGWGNICGSLFGAIFSAGSMSCLASFKAGARTPLSGVICGLVLLLVVTLLAPLVGKIPLVVLSAIIIYIGISIFDAWILQLGKKLMAAWKDREQIAFAHIKEIVLEITVIAVVTIITISVNLVWAVGAGVVIASVMFMAKLGKSVIRRKYFGNRIHSKKVRNIYEDGILKKKGKQIAVFELSGSLFFGSAENLAEEIDRYLPTFTYFILDLKHLNNIDSTGAKSILQINSLVTNQGKHLRLSYVQANDDLWEFLNIMGVMETLGADHFFPDTDTALEWAENHLLAHLRKHRKADFQVPLELMEFTQGLSPAELRALKSRLVHETYAKGTIIFREGDETRDLCLLLKGLVSVKIRLPHQDRCKRLVTLAAGDLFGEVALLDGEARSAFVLAEEDCEILRLPCREFGELSQKMPAAAFKLMQNLAKILTHRLRRLSLEVGVLEEF